MNLYKVEEANSMRFYKVPKELCENEKYSTKLNSDAKLIYSLLLDRMELSRVNNWVNELGEIFLLYNKEQIGKMLGITRQTVTKAFKQLKLLELIKEERQGLNTPNKIYIGKMEYENPHESRMSKIFTSECQNNLHQDVKNINTNETEIKETELNETDNIIAEDKPLPVSKKGKKYSDEVKEVSAYLKDKLLNKGVSKSSFPKDWHIKNYAVIQSFISDNITKDDIIKAIDWGLQDQYWKDKIDSMNTVKRYMPKYQLQNRNNNTSSDNDDYWNDIFKNKEEVKC